MKKEVFVSVSTDPVKEYQSVIEYAKKLQGEADFLHCDIMDGQFVERLTYDAGLVANINQNSLISLDVHLMCNEPFKLIDDYLRAGANIITIHYEAFADKNQIIDAVKKIKKSGALAGISFKPSTSLKDIKIYLHNFDVALVMSVEPGLSGQKFMPEALARIAELDRYRRENNLNFKIEVDGGVNGENAKEIVDAGCDILVSGSYIYKSNDKIATIKSLKEI